MRLRWTALSPRTLRVLAVGGTTYAARMASATVVVVTIPLARHALDPELFGVWMMLSALMVFLSFADLGIGNGVLNRVTAAHASGSAGERDRIVAAGYVCTGALGTALLAIWLIWSVTATEPTAVAGPISSMHQSEVLVSLHVFAALLAVNVPASVIQKVQLGSQMGHWVGVTQSIASIATLMAIPTVLTLGGGLASLVLAALGMQVLGNVVSSLLWLHQTGTLRRLSLSLVERAVVVDLFRLGSLFFALQLAAAFAFHSDAIVITHQVGQAAYGDFAAVQRLFLAVTALLAAGLLGLWPAFGEAIARDDIRWVKAALGRFLLAAALLVGAVCAVLVVSMNQITHWWLDSTMTPPLAMTLVLAAWTLVESVSVITAALLNAAGLLRAQVVVAITLALAAFGAKWPLVAALGPYGAVLATLLAYLGISVPAQVYILKRYFEDRECAHVG